MPMRANIVGPPCSATSSSAFMAASHSSASCVEGGVAERDQLLALRQFDRFGKSLDPRTRIHPLDANHVRDYPLTGGAVYVSESTRNDPTATLAVHCGERLRARLTTVAGRALICVKKLARRSYRVTRLSRMWRRR
jgi:hypothetical protein